MEYLDIVGNKIEEGSIITFILQKELAFAKVVRLAKTGSKYEQQQPLIYGKRVFKKTKAEPVRHPWGVEMAARRVWVTDGTPQPIRDHQAQALVLPADVVPEEVLKLL